MERTLLVVGGLLLLAVVLMGAVTPNAHITPQTPKLALVRFVQGTDAVDTYKTVFTAGADGSRCTGLWTTNDDTAATHVLKISIQRGGVDYVVSGTYTTVLAGGSPTGLTPASLLSSTVWPGLPTTSDGNPELVLESGDVLRAQYATALTAGKIIYLGAMCWNF